MNLESDEIDFDGPPEELDDVMGECQDWFPPSEGVAALRAVAGLIRSDAAVADGFE